MNHHCHLPGCTTPVPRKLLLCAPHWRKVPRGIQLRVYRHFNPEQVLTLRPSPEYCKAAYDAVIAALDALGDNDPKHREEATVYLRLGGLAEP